MAEEVTEGGSKLPLIIGGVVVVGVIGAIWLMSKKKKTYAAVAPTATTDDHPRRPNDEPVEHKPQSTKPQSVGDIVSGVGSIVSRAGSIKK